MIQETQIVNRQLQVTLSRGIHAGDVEGLKQAFDAFFDKGQASLLIDMSKVDYIDSAGLGMLVALKKRALRNGGNIRLHGLQGLVGELFELTQLTKMFEIMR